MNEEMMAKKWSYSKGERSAQETLQLNRIFISSDDYHYFDQHEIEDSDSEYNEKHLSSSSNPHSSEFGHFQGKKTLATMEWKRLKQISTEYDLKNQNVDLIIRVHLTGILFCDRTT